MWQPLLKIFNTDFQNRRATACPFTSTKLTNKKHDIKTKKKETSE